MEEIDKDSELTKFPISLQQFEEIEFKDVFFSYPDTENYILKGLNLKIEKNKKYALVGKNGAGKTTITKLLTGLYDNYSGLILINGKDIKEWNKQELRNYFSIVYQDFAQYQISLRDNIKLGMVGEDLPEKKLKDVLESVGLLEMVENLPNGVDAHLGKLFDKGVDVSGGQWQKIAMARALVGNTQINIFDEPTKALDPISESKVYEDFASFSQEKTTILITHRLGAARIANEIILIDEGISKEQGSHDELVEKNGLYKTMFLSQRRWYDEN